MRRVEGMNVEIRAIGIPRPAEPALNAAFAAVTRIDGAAADGAVAVLRAAGARKGLVNLGGSHVTVFGEPLVVAVPDPTDVTQARWASFKLEAALARATRAGRGDGAAETLAVTAVSRSASEAAAVAAAALPLKPADAVALLAQRGAAGFVQTREGSIRVIVTTSGFGASHDLRAEAGVQVRP